MDVKVEGELERIENDEMNPRVMTVARDEQVPQIFKIEALASKDHESYNNEANSSTSFPLSSPPTSSVSPLTPRLSSLSPSLHPTPPTDVSGCS
ncbi:hypothetical protein QJS10_CPB21g01151 [Acorus calamus]|uniref:Uncharacterized protein n=1 Tax=Acorus calamus TaxID=4465 RepID=A0AAV9C764_ACOCL|nr:hypothetical protein QJS10_CPB21g01151 [Acorus calamus]